MVVMIQPCDVHLHVRSLSACHSYVTLLAPEVVDVYDDFRPLTLYVESQHRCKGYSTGPRSARQAYNPMRRSNVYTSPPTPPTTSLLQTRVKHPVSATTGVTTSKHVTGRTRSRCRLALVVGSRCRSWCSQTSLCPLQRKYAEAEPLHLRSIGIQQEMLGPDHPTTAGTLNSLAHLLQAQVRVVIPP